MKNKIFRYLSAREAYWIFIFIYCLTYLTLLRIVFYLTHQTLWQIDEVGDVMRSLLLGIRFDSVTTAYVVFPLYFISLFLSFKISARPITKIFSVIITFLFAAITFLALADISFYNQFGSRLNYWAVEYLVYPDMFLYGIASARNFWITILAWLAISVLFYWGQRRSTSFVLKSASRPGIIPGIIINIAFSIFVLLGMRGSTGIKALDWGKAYFCDNQFINQAALNPVFTLSHSIYEEWRDGKSLWGIDSTRFQYFPPETAATIIAEMLNRPAVETNPPTHIKPILESSPRKPNLIIIIEESWTADMIGTLGAEHGVSPQFDRLAKQGLLFTRFYANGIRTNRGLPAVLCSFPSLPGRSIMKRYAAEYPFQSIAEILKPYNYTSVFAYGGDIEFDNMRGFLKSVGYDIFYGDSEFEFAGKGNKWGAPDHIVFKRLLDKIPTLPRPFNLTILTLSNHEPFILPEERYRLYDDTVSNAKSLNTFHYSDGALGEFISTLAELPVFDSTIFIVTSDHCPHQSPRYVIDPVNFHIPLLIFGAGLGNIAPKRINKIGSQVDILPTLTSILNIKDGGSFWGRDLLGLEESDSGFAVLTLDNRIGIIKENLLLVKITDEIHQLFDLGQKPYLTNNLYDSNPEVAREIRIELEAYMQQSYTLSRGYHKK